MTPPDRPRLLKVALWIMLAGFLLLVAAAAARSNGYALPSLVVTVAFVMILTFSFLNLVSGLFWGVVYSRWSIVYRSQDVLSFRVAMAMHALMLGLLAWVTFMPFFM